MPFTVTPRAQEALTERGWFLNGRIQRKLIIPEVAKELRDHTSPETAVSNDKLCLRLFGHSDESLRYIMAQLTAPGSDGPVQRHLNGDGWMLCATAVSEVITDDGGAIERRVSGRFITNDPDTVEKYLLESRRRRTLSAVESTVNLMKLAVQRIPALEPKIRPLIREIVGQSEERFTKAFPPGSASGKKGVA